jgi:hypothetical protein
MAAADDTAYQGNPYGTADPTALFQQFSQQNAKGPMGGMNQGLMQAGLNPTMQHAQQVQNSLQAILASNQPEEGEDPLDAQMRQAKAVATGMLRVDPQVAMRADQQTLRLQNAKVQQAQLTAETAAYNAKTQQANVDMATDPMVMVKPGKDAFGLPTASVVGNSVPITDEKGGIRTGWSSDVSSELQKNPGTQAMRQSQYLDLIEKMNEGRNITAYARAQAQLQQFNANTMSPDAIHAYNDQVVAGLAPVMKLPSGSSRSPAQTTNYNNAVLDLQQRGVDPGSLDDTAFKNNISQLNAFNHGQQADVVRSLNTAVQHAKLLKDYFTAQQNNDTPALNWIENKWADLKGQPIPKTVDAMKQFVSDEWVKGIVGQRPALADRIMAQDSASRNASPAQFASIMDGWAGLGAGQLNSLRREMEGGLKTGTGDPWSQDKMDRLWYGADASGRGGKVAPETRAYMEQAKSNNDTITNTSAGAGTMHVVGPNGKSGTVPKGTPLPPGWKEG